MTIQELIDMLEAACDKGGLSKDSMVKAIDHYDTGEFEIGAMVYGPATEFGRGVVVLQEEED